MRPPIIPMQGDQAPSASSSDNNQPTLEFTRTVPEPQEVIKTGLTQEHIEMIADWERKVWGEEGRDFVGAVSQFDQELSEARNVWINVIEGETSLEDDQTTHQLRAEIGDGLISNIGILRQFEKDNDKAGAFLYRALHESSKSKKRSTESSIVLYQLKGQKLLDRIRECGKDCPEEMSKAEKNEILMMVGSVMKAGFEALEKLGIDAGDVVSDKVKLNTIKYSEGRVRSKGSVNAAKEDWNVRQLPIARQEVVFKSAA